MGKNRLLWYCLIFLIAFSLGYLLNLLPQISLYFIIPYLAVLWGLKELDESLDYREIREAFAHSLAPQMSERFFSIALIIVRAGAISGSLSAWL